MVEASSNTCWEDRATSNWWPYISDANFFWSRSQESVIASWKRWWEHCSACNISQQWWAQHEQWFHGDHAGPPRVAGAGAVFLPRSLLGVGGDSVIENITCFVVSSFCSWQCKPMSWVDVQHKCLCMQEWGSWSLVRCRSLRFILFWERDLGLFLLVVAGRSWCAAMIGAHLVWRKHMKNKRHQTRDAGMINKTWHKWWRSSARQDIRLQTFLSILFVVGHDHGLVENSALVRKPHINICAPIVFNVHLLALGSKIIVLGFTVGVLLLESSPHAYFLLTKFTTGHVCDVICVIGPDTRFCWLFALQMLAAGLANLLEVPAVNWHVIQTQIHSCLCVTCLFLDLLLGTFPWKWVWALNTDHCVIAWFSGFGAPLIFLSTARWCANVGFQESEFPGVFWIHVVWSHLCVVCACLSFWWTFKPKVLAPLWLSAWLLALEEYPGGGSVRMARCGLVGRSDKNWAMMIANPWFWTTNLSAMKVHASMRFGTKVEGLWCGHAWRSRTQSPTSAVLGTSKTTLDWTKLSGACVPSKPLPLLATVFSGKHSWSAEAMLSRLVPWARHMKSFACSQMMDFNSNPKLQCKKQWCRTQFLPLATSFLALIAFTEHLAMLRFVFFDFSFCFSCFFVDVPDDTGLDKIERCMCARPLPL